MAKKSDSAREAESLRSSMSRTQFARAGTRSRCGSINGRTAATARPQDMWWLSGIFRDVSLIAKPKASIWDVRTRTTFNAGYHAAVLSVAALPHGDAAGFTILATLLDDDSEVAKAKAFLQSNGPVGFRDAGDEPVQVVSRNASPLHADHIACGCQRQGDRGNAPQGRVPAGRDERRETCS